MANRYEYMVWDWNGTLLDDCMVCIHVMDRLLKTRGLPLIETRERYWDVFGFPVMHYYQRLGFDFEQESFDAVAQVYMADYRAAALQASLHENTLDVLARLKSAGIRQVIISASEKKILLEQARHFGVDKYIDDILGIDDIYGAGKIALAERWKKENLSGGENVLMAGDSVHDYEVAAAVGFDCVLIPGGHQGKIDLEKCGARIVENLTDVVGLVLS